MSNSLKDTAAEFEKLGAMCATVTTLAHQVERAMETLAIIKAVQPATNFTLVTSRDALPSVTLTFPTVAEAEAYYSAALATHTGASNAIM